MDHLWVKEHLNQEAEEYLLILGESYNQDLKEMAKELNCHPKDVIRYALINLKHTVYADAVFMQKDDDNTYEVKVR